MKKLPLIGFIKEYNLEDDTKNKTEFKKVYIYSFDPGDFIITTDKGVVKIDDESLVGTHSTCCYIKDNES